MSNQSIRENLSHSEKQRIYERLTRERLATVNRLHEGVHFHETFYTKYGKRFLDIIISLIAVALTLPINLMIGVITFFDVGRPIFFKQQRIGKSEKVFSMLKFRNMTNETDANGELLPPAQRVTKWGRIVRKTSLDELLNFWSVLKGDMSIIGPRPLIPATLSRYSDRHRARFYVRPGLECPPRDKLITARTWNDQFENDIWYVEHISLKTDCKMLVNLVRFTFDRKNSEIRGNAKRGTFLGYSLDGKAISEYDLPEELLIEYSGRNM